MSHERWREMIAPYALGIQKPDERVQFQTHLTECAECRAELKTLRETVVSTLGPPAPPVTIGLGLGEPTRKRKTTLRLPWHLTALAFALAIAAGYAFWDARQEQMRLRSALDLAELGKNSFVQTSGTRDSVVETITGRGVRIAWLRAAGGRPAARVYWNPGNRVLVLSTWDIPRPASGRTYQMWATTPGRNPVSVGTFHVSGIDENVTLRAPASTEFLGIEISNEPEGGSRYPTTQPFVSGNLID